LYPVEEAARFAAMEVPCEAILSVGERHALFEDDDEELRREGVASGGRRGHVVARSEGRGRWSSEMRR